MRVAALAVLLCACAPAAEREFSETGAELTTVALGSYNVNPKETTVSGVSSGGYMAVQFGVAWSSTVRGVGAFAAGPFWCAQDSLTTATGTCQIGSPGVTASTAKTDSYAASGAIDATSNLAKQKIWIFSGYNDGVVKRSVVNSLNSYYAHYLDSGSVFYKTNLNAGHSQVTDSFGGSCVTTGNEFINNCAYDAAGLLLKHLFGTLNARNTGTLTGKVIAFDQGAFTSTAPANLSMSNTGYAYVPASCAAGGQCRVHIAFHGCLQNADDYVGTDFVNHAGYNQWADTNGLIILYPQTVSSSAAPLNPNGCWDWWGYNEAGYATKNGSQITAIKGMLNRLSAGYTGWSAAPTGTFGAPAGLTATDSSNTSIALAWTGVGGATGYNVYRATCATCAFTKANAALVTSPSYADNGRAAGTTYFYKVRAFNGTSESTDSAVVSRATPAASPACDPYYRDNYTHTIEGRAYALFGATYADGSNTYIGLWNIFTETNLIQTSAGFFRPATCP
jgi:poly(3-hydroxybutyrate) depolymerase